jgi:hypothetical protein
VKFQEVISSVMEMRGVLGAAIIDLFTGKTLDFAGDATKMEQMGAVCVSVLGAQIEAQRQFGLPASIDEATTRVGSVIQIVRPLSPTDAPSLFFYVIASNERTNLAQLRAWMGASALLFEMAPKESVDAMVSIAAEPELLALPEISSPPRRSRRLHQIK